MAIEPDARLELISFEIVASSCFLFFSMVARIIDWQPCSRWKLKPVSNVNIDDDGEDTELQSRQVCQLEGAWKGVK